MKTYPLTQPQLGIYLECIQNPKLTEYNLPFYGYLPKTLDPEKIVEAVKKIYATRKELRIRFTQVDDTPRQYVTDPDTLKINRLSMSGKEEVDAYLKDFVQPYDIFNEPLFRCTLIETPENYVLVAEVHHLIADGMTIATCFTTRDFPLAYAGEPLPEDSLGMLEYAEEEEASFHTPEYERAKQYYMEKYDGTSMCTMATQSVNPLGKQLRYSEFLPLEDVDNWCKEHGAQANLLFMASFSYVMGMLTREKNVVFTSLNHGRIDKRIRSSYGMFVRLVPTKAVIDMSSNVMDFIKNFRMELMSTIRYAVYPYSHFCSDLGMSQGVQFSFQSGKMLENLIVDGESYQFNNIQKTETSEDLSCVIYDRDGKYDIRMEASSSLYSLETMQLVAKAIKACTLDMMNHADGMLSDISIVSDEEKAHIMAMSAGKEMPVDKSQTFPSIFMSQAAKTPTAPAVVDEKGTLTYHELNNLSNIVAHALVNADDNEKKSPFVSIMLGYQKEFIAVAIGIEKAGMAYVPLDYDYPNDRLLYMLEDSESSVLITSHAIFDEKNTDGEFNNYKGTVLFIDDLLNVDADVDAVTDINNAVPDGIAYMIYTSGSTGKPKGVMIPHRAKANFVQFIAKEWGHSSKSHICCHSSFSFDASIEDLYPVLTVGGTLYTVPKDARKDMELLHKFIIDNGITGGCYTTQLGQMLLQMHPDLPVDYLVVGGEKMTVAPKCNCRLINTYGPTEFTVDATFFDVTPGKEYTNIPIGHALGNLHAYVVDAAGQLMPEGIAGELCMAGPQMAAGYWKREDLTAEKFTKCPFADGMMYHTGDLVRYNEDGEIEYMGRIDSQVKLRGFRIELGEIETLTASFDDITMVSVQVKEVGGVQHLVAYYSAKTEIDKAVLKDYLSQSLTDYMVPDVYMQLDAMPLTPNGKVNTKALPTPVLEKTEYVEPEGEKETAVAECISQVLSIDDKVGALDNFFSLGGDSIKSIRLVSLLRQRNISLTIADVMKGKTVREIAALAESGESIDIPQDTLEGEIPESAIQRWFFAQQLPHAEHYNQSVAFKVDGSGQAVDVEKLKAALDAVVKHHDMLRLRAEDTRIYINNVESPLYDFIEKDVKDVSGITAESDSLQSKINLKDGPLMKVALFHVNADLSTSKQVLVMICHHLAVDGVSWRIIAEDLNNAYQMALEGKEITLPKKTHSFKYYAEAISRYRDSYRLSTEKAYWQDVQRKMADVNVNANLSSLRQAQDRLSTSSSSSTLKKLHIDFSDAAIGHMTTDANVAYNTNENDLLITALVRSYHKMTGKDSVSILMEGHGREPIGEPLVIDRTVGWFTSTYPVVIENINGDIRHDIRSVKETFRNIPNNGLGYGILQYIPSGEGDTGLRTDLVETLGLNYLGELAESMPASTLTLASDISTGRMVNQEGLTGPSFMIDCSIAPLRQAQDELSSTMNIDATYDPDVWTEERAKEMVENFRQELKDIITFTIGVKEPETTASDLGMAGWTDEQYEAIVADYAKRGESLERIYPLSPMQEGILLEYMMNPKTTTYVLLDRFALDILPTEDQMRYVLDSLVTKHEVFRTSIIFNGIDNPCQAITLGRKAGLKFVDISHEADIMAASQRIHDEQLHAGFNLQTDPLLRIVVMKTSESSCHILFCTHHIIVDGWCLPIYFSDFFNLLKSVSDTKMEVSAEDKGRYEQAIRDILALDKKASLGYWKNIVAGYTDKAIIPYSDDDKTTGNQSEMQTMVMTAELENKLKAVASTYGVTLNTIVELTWGLVLQTYNRSEDVIFGKVVSGRNHGDVADLVGLFINTIPVRVATNKEMTIGVALQTLQQQASESTQHDYCSLSEIQRLTDIPGGLIQSQVLFENYEGSDTLWNMSRSSGITVLQSDEVNFSELNLTVGTGEDGLLLVKIAYDGRLYSRETIAHVKDLFFHILEEIGHDANRKISEIPLISEEEIKKIVELSAGPRMDVDFTKTYLDFFLDRCSGCPEALAVADDKSEITYAQLDRRSDLIAHKLMEVGVGYHSFVGVMIDRSKEFPVCVFGIHKAGGAYLPLDIEYPNERLQYMMEDSGTKVLITTHKVLEEKRREASFEADTIIYIDDINWEKESADIEPVNNCTPSCYTYIIYTSGSTGKPKGVVLHHKGLLNYIFSTISELHLTKEDRISSHRSFSFDSHIEDMYAILLLGGSLHIMPEDIRKDLNQIYDFVVRHKITGGGYTTSIATMLCNNFDMPVRYISAIGEKLMGVVSHDAQIVNAYGPTECTDHISIYYLEKDKVYKDIPIGHVIANNWCFIVDPAGHLAPQGVAGELCIAGIQVGVGYWQRPELNAKAYVECPFVEKNIDGTPVRMYHTGDLARFGEDGQLECIGRIDNQVKLRGYRIELGEIETEGMKVQGIQQTVAAIREVNGAKHLVLYYTVEQGCKVTSEQLHESMSHSKLASYMVPEVYMFLEAMPRTPNGKINRKALPEPEMEAAEMVAPETEMEKSLFDVLAQLMKNDQFGVTTPLISVGMTSLLAMRASAAISKELGITLSTKDILQKGTIRELAKIAEASVDTSSQGSVQGIADVDLEKREYYPITEVQRGVYVDWELHRDTTQYNIPMVTEYKDITAEKLRDALVAVINAHPFVKTHLTHNDGDVVMVRQDETPVNVSIQTLSDTPDKIFFQSKVLPFNLFKGPLYRLEIYVVNPATNSGQSPAVYLFRDFHHIVFDGGSNAVFETDLEKALRGEALETETFSQYERSLVEQAFWNSDAYKESEKYYDGLLSGLEATSYPQSSIEKNGKDDTFEISIPKEQIHSFCKSNSITESNYFLTIFLQLLHRVTREEDVVITTVHHGRTDLRMIDDIGMFVKTQPVVSHFTKEDFSKSVAECAGDIQQQLFATQNQNIYSFTKIVERYGIHPDIMYVYQGGLEDDVDDEVDVNSYSLEQNTAKLPLSVLVYPKDKDSYALMLEYNGSIYCEADMRLLGEMMNTACLSALNAKKVSDISVVRDDQISEIKNLSAGTTMPVEEGATFIKRFIQQSEAHPDNVAVCDAVSKFTYGELNILSNIFAHKLIADGVEPDSFVCILMDRCKEFVLSVLSIHKAGAAYTPLDIDYPIDRLQYMLEDCESNVLITTHDALSKKQAEGLHVDENKVKILYMDDANDVNTDTNVEAINLATPESLAYMIYTSGSTGKPKGTMLHQKGLMNFAQAEASYLSLTSDDRIACHRSFSFDAHLCDLYPILFVGGQIHIMPSEIRKDLDAMYKFIVDRKITGFGGTTSLMMLFINNYDLPLRFITAGGEKLSGVKSDTMTIVNLYGPTECTNDSTYFMINPGEEYDNIPIGRPLPNVNCYIMDKTGHLLPQGIAGELCITGAQVGYGYWHLPEKTSEAFVDNPFGEGKLYHTGDLACYNADGQIEYMGRIDGQVKLRGFRIELGEIEATAMQHESVRQAAALVKEVNGQRHLILYYTLEKDKKCTKEELSAYLDSTSLAKYMLPEIYMQLDTMPLLPSSKINRKALPEPVMQACMQCVPPANFKEAKLLEILSGLLKTDAFGVTDNLFDVGLTSLIAIKAAAEANRFNITFKVEDLIKLKTIRDLLNHNMNLVFWYNGYSADKPVVVVTCGETLESYLDGYLDQLSKKYSVFVIEPITAHFQYLFARSDMHEVIEMYYALMDYIVPTDAKIVAFSGHCFGGELAYRLAIRYAEATGQQLPVLMLDVYWLNNPELKFKLIEVEDIPEDYAKEHEDKVITYSQILNMYKLLETEACPPIHKGKMYLVRSLGLDDVDRDLQEMENRFFPDGSKHSVAFSRFVDNEKFWRQYYPDLQCTAVNAGHLGMLADDSLVETYVKIMDDIVKGNM